MASINSIIKHINLCEKCFLKKADYYFEIYYNSILKWQKREFFLCEDCIKAPEFHILSAGNIGKSQSKIFKEFYDKLDKKKEIELKRRFMMDGRGNNDDE